MCGEGQRYGVGAGDDVVVVDVPAAGDDVVVVLEPLVAPAGEGFTMVVLFSVFVPGDAAVVVVG